MAETRDSTPRRRVKQYENRIPCGRCGHVHLATCPTCNHCPQIESPNEELAERIGYKIQKLLTRKYGNSLKIAVGIIRQELEKAQR